MKYKPTLVKLPRDVSASLLNRYHSLLLQVWQPVWVQINECKTNRNNWQKWRRFISTQCRQVAAVRNWWWWWWWWWWWCVLLSHFIYLPAILHPYQLIHNYLHPWMWRRVACMKSWAFLPVCSTQVGSNWSMDLNKMAVVKDLLKS